MKLSSFDRCSCWQRLLVNRFVRHLRHNFFLSSSCIGKTCSKRYVFQQNIIRCCQERLKLNAIFSNSRKRNLSRLSKSLAKKYVFPTRISQIIIIVDLLNSKWLHVESETFRLAIFVRRKYQQYLNESRELD